MPKKPPIDKKAVRSRLQTAQDGKLLCRVRRWIPDADRVEGFVVGIGKEWVALHRLSDRVTFDGWILIRVKDIQAVTIYPEENGFEIKALKARDEWPPRAPELDLDGTLGVITSASEMTPMISVHREFERPDSCWIGSVVSLDQARLRLLEVDVTAVWARKPRAFDPDDITRLDFGGGYEEALRLVAGPVPRVR